MPHPTTPSTTHLTRHPDIRTALTDPALTVPPPTAAAPPRTTPDPPTAPPGQLHSMAWLRSTVARFSSGPAHTRRRANATTALATLDPTTLRTNAHHLTRSTPPPTAGPDPTADPADLPQLPALADLARRVPVTVLATALGATDVPAAVTATLRAAPAYLPPPPAPPASTGPSPDPADQAVDQAVAELMGLLADGSDGAPADDEVTANRVGLLMQACEATAGLIRNALPHSLSPEHAGIRTEALLAEVLRHDPPVRLTRRVAQQATTAAGAPVPAGRLVVLHLAEGNRDPDVFTDPDRFDPDRFDPARDHRAVLADVLTFGNGDHRCPGSHHALALAAGVLDALRDHHDLLDSASPEVTG